MTAKRPTARPSLPPIFVAWVCAFVLWRRPSSLFRAGRPNHFTHRFRHPFATYFGLFAGRCLAGFGRGIIANADAKSLGRLRYFGHQYRRWAGHCSDDWIVRHESSTGYCTYAMLCHARRDANHLHRLSRILSEKSAHQSNTPYYCRGGDFQSTVWCDGGCHGPT